MRSFLTLLLLAAGSCTAVGAQGRINAGGPAVTDALGQVWAADQFFKGGTISSGPIPAGAPIYYATKRYGDFSYLLPVPDGAYTVGLGFLENVAMAAGGRVFSVSINGAAVLTSYDIVADVGLNVPVRKVFSALAAGGKGISIGFTTVARSAVVNSIDYSAVPDTVGIRCAAGSVDFSQLNTTAKGNLEVQIIGALSGDFRLHHVLVAEHSQFTGLSDLTVSMGRPGTNNFELTGALVPLGLSAGDTNHWLARPDPPQISGSYAVVLNFQTAGLLTLLTGGSLRWEVCGFVAPAVTTAQASGVGVFPPAAGNPGYVLILLPSGAWCSLLPRVASLQVCSGSGVDPGTGLGWDCAGFYQGRVLRADGSLLSLVGFAGLPGVNPAAVWTDVR